MKICIIGTGYVGLVTGACLSDFGLEVTCVDQDEAKISLLNSGGIPIYEQNLEEIINKNVKAGRLSFTTDIENAVKESEVIFIAVGTPPNHDGSADLTQIKNVAGQIARCLNGYKVIVNKSTVPVGTVSRIKKIITENQNPSLRATEGSAEISNEENSHCEEAERPKQFHSTHVIPDSSSVIPAKTGIHPSVIARSDPSSVIARSDPSSVIARSDPSSVIARSEATRQSQKEPIPFDVVSNPEFLREGSAVQDFTHPDKIVIGTDSDRALKIMQEIYRPLYLIDTPFVFTNPETAEMIKYACNSFLATKITFINEIANLCDKVGADVHQIARAMGLDGRISPKFLHPGPGYGGSCFPKDTRALCSISESNGYEFVTLNAVVSANKRQRELMIEKIKHLLKELKGKTIGILGLAFKQSTDDIRESSSIDIVKILLKEGVKIRCFDPMAMENAKKILPDLTYCQDEYETARGSDALVIATEWNEFRNLDLYKIKELLKNPIFIDLRNLYETEKVKALGFIYEGVGRR